MQSQAQRLFSLLRTIVLAGVTTFLITSALPLPAQDSVPSTARQAATMPQFAAKLAHGVSRESHPVAPRASYKRRGDAGTKHSWVPQGFGLYDNGPVNGTTDAWTINFGFVASDTFTVGSGAGPVNGIDFYAWTLPGDVVENVEVSITSSEFGGTTYTDQIVDFTQSNCSTNQLGYNVCLESSSSFTPVNLAAGTYWVNLQNAVVSDGDPLFWDENSGVGCESQGCPSLASENSVGTIPSESFSMLGNGSPTCFESQGNLQIIYNFTGQQGGPNGVALDRAGNLYGTGPSGGNNSAGFAFKLARFANWLLDPLFSFFGGYNGGQPTGAIVGPNGTLYGGAAGGIQNCGSEGNEYCGLVYNLTPQPTTCRTSVCSWTENVPYRFTSEIDGSDSGLGGINLSAYDQQGNLYGTTYAGGTYDAGTVFELTPSGGGWTKTTLYSFTGGVDGSSPSEVLVGNDGNLYGVAGGYMYETGVVFRLRPSGGQWIESVLFAFNQSEGIPSYLAQDGAGNLYGLSRSSEILGPAAIFALERTNSGWVFSEYFVYHDDCETDFLNNLTVDAAGNLYGTGGTFTQDEECSSGYIFKASYGSDGWHYQDLAHLPDQIFPAGGSLAVDSSGNVYGTTAYCGTNDAGTVWQVSP